MSLLGQNMHALPKVNVSLNDRERARLERLADLRGAKVSRVIADAVTHTLASLELAEPIHVVVPSEERDEGKPGSPKA